MKFVYLFIVLVVCCFTSCKECPTIEPPPPEELWEKFVGQYKVTALESGQEYYMSINHWSDTNEFGLRVDSIAYINFGNSFYLKNNFNNNEDDYFLQLNGGNPVTDNNNNRWALWLIYQDTLTSDIENTLINDTILFYFKKDNTAYWLSDGTQYYSCDCKHLAVKISD
jgi:hypothetical protein